MISVDEKNTKAKKRAREWYLKNKEITIQRAREWKKDNPEKVKKCAKVYRDATRDRMKVLVSRWAKNNPEKVRERSRRYYAKHADVMRERSRNYYANNPEKAKASRDRYRATSGYRIVNSRAMAKRRALLCDESGRVSKDVVGRLLALQRGRCAACGDVLGEGYHIDHIMPLALGGKHAENNLQLLHKKCNLQKHAKHPIDFMRSKGYLL